MQAARFGVGQDQRFARARDAHIGESPLFFEAPGFVERFLAREQAVFEADEEDERKLQALGRMQRHQLHAVLPGLALRLAGFERGVGEERSQLGETGFDILRRALETAGDVDEFVEIFHSRFGTAARIGFVEIAQAGVLDAMVDLFGKRKRRVAVGGTGPGHFIDQGQERFERMLDSLQLNADQKTQVNQILSDTRTQLQALRQESEPRVSEIRRQADERLQKVLTPDQWKQFELERDKLRSRDRRGRGNASGNP